MSASETIRTVGERLSEEEDSTLCRVTERVASSLHDAGNYIVSNDPRTMARDAQSFARRHRELVVGGALVAGLLLGRFLRTGLEESSGSGGDSPPEGEGEDGGRASLDGRGVPHEREAAGGSSDLSAGGES